MTSFTHTHNAGIDSYLFGNGFKLIMAHYPGAPNARVELVVRVGSKNEGYGETGMAHLLEHMLFKSSPVADDMKTALTAMSSEWNGTTSVDNTNYYEIVTPEKVLSALELEYNRLLNATFTEEHLRTEMTVVRNEMDRGASDTNNVMVQTMTRSAFDWHGYGRSTIGSPSDVEDAPVAALRAFYKQHYRASNAFLFLAGNFDRAAVLDYVSSHFGAVQAQGDELIATANWTVEDGHHGATRRDVFMPMNKVQAWLGWRMPPMFSREAVALQLAMQTLGSEERGALRKALVIDEKKLVDLQATPYDLVDGGLYLLMGHGQSSDNPHELADTIASRVYAHVAGGMNEQDLEDTRQDELSQYHEVLGSWENLSYVLVDAELQGDWQWMFARKAMVESVSYEEMMAAARKWIVPHSQTTVYLHNGTPVSPALFKVPAPVVFPEYPSVIQESDRVASSYEELNDQEVVWHADSHLRVSMAKRSTQAGYLYVEFENTVGDDASRAPHFGAAQCARELRSFGGAGRGQKAFNAWLNANKAEVQFRTMGFSMKVPPENGLAILSTVLDVFHAPQFTLDEFNAFKEKKLSKLKAAMAKLEPVLSTTLAQQWSNYPEGHWGSTPTLDATYDSVRAVQYEDALASLAWMSRRGTARLTLVGPLEQTDVQALAAEYVAKHAPDTQHTHLPVVRPNFEENLHASKPIRIELGNSPNATVGAAAPLHINSFHADAPALVAAVHVFGGGATSRLWMRIREQGGMAYQVGAGLALSAQGLRTTLSMMSSCSAEQMNDVHAAMVEEWSRLLSQGITQEELDESKAQRALFHQSEIQNDAGYVDVYHRAPITQQDYLWRASFQKAERELSLDAVNGAVAKHLVGLPVQWALARSIPGAQSSESQEDEKAPEAATA